MPARERHRRALVTAALALLVLLGAWLRLEEALETVVMAGEDGYVHLARARYMLKTGAPRPDYPPGLQALIAALGAAWPGAMVPFVRWGPGAVGGLAVVAWYALGRRLGGDAAGLTAAAAVAVMPEAVFRGEILIPTALDVLLIPVLLLAGVAALEGRAWGWPAAGAAGAAITLTHPWALAVVAPAAAIYAAAWALHAHRARRGRGRGARSAAAIVLVALLLAAGALTWVVATGQWNPLACCADALAENARQLPDRSDEVFHYPWGGTLADLVAPATLALAAAGAVAAVARRDRLGGLGLALAAPALPLTAYDWFGLPYLPRRTAVYAGLAAALLAATAARELTRWLPRAPLARRRPRAAAAALLVAFLAASAPAVAGMEEWHRRYTPSDYAGFERTADLPQGKVIVGAWQARTGLFALHGENASLDARFFANAEHRQAVVAENLTRGPVYVLVDVYLAHNAQRWGLSLAFLDSAAWQPVLQWDRGRVYRYAGPASGAAA